MNKNSTYFSKLVVFIAFIILTANFAFSQSANFTINNSSQCLIGNSFVFTNTSTSGSTAYQWSFGDGTTSAATNPTKTYTSSGNFSVQLIATIAGINYYVNKTVYVNPVPQCSFTFLAATSTGNSYTFLSTSSIASGSMNYSWDFGDGGTATSSNPTHTYAANGSYVITLTVTSDMGCACSISQNVVVSVSSGGTAPNLSFATNNTTQCVTGNNFSFTNTSTASGATYSWDFGDGAISSIANPTHSYASAGTYVVKLIANISGTLYYKSQIITVSAAATATISGTACTGSTLTLSSSSTNIASIQWKNGGSVVATNTAIWNNTSTIVAGNNGQGNGTNQFVSYVTDIYVDKQGNIYVIDDYQSKVKKFAAGSTTWTLVATGTQITGLGVDDAGNLYTVDDIHNWVQKWTPGSLTPTTVAGGNGLGAALNQLHDPRGNIYIAPNGSIYINDGFNYRIVRWDVGATNGVVVAGGNGSGSATNQIGYSRGFYVDALGNIYVADRGNFRVSYWAVGAINGVTVAGGNGQGIAANQFTQGPQNVWADAAGNIFTTDDNENRMRVFTTLSANGVAVFTGGSISGNVDLSIIYLDQQTGCIYQLSPNYPSGANVLVNKFCASSISQTFSPSIAGTYTAVITTFGGCGATSNAVTVNATPVVADITGASSVCAGNTTTLANTTVGGTWSSSNTAIATINSSGVVTGVGAGTATITYTVNNSGCIGSATKQIVINPLPTVSLSGTGSCASTLTATISGGVASSLVWTLNGTPIDTAYTTYNANATTVAGTGVSGSSATQFNGNNGVIVDAFGNMYVADANNNRIQKFAAGSTAGVTVAGGNGFGNALNQVYSPRGIFVDGNGYLYVADGNSRVLKFPPNSTSATNGLIVAGGNGFGSALNQVGAPAGLFVDAAGNIYVSDPSQYRVMKFPANSTSATNGVIVAGGTAGNAANELQNPLGIYVDAADNVFVADAGNNRIQKWASGAVTGITVAGAVAGPPDNAHLAFVTDVFVDALGNVYTLDYFNRVMRWEQGASTGTVLFGSNYSGGSGASELQNPNGFSFAPNGDIYVSDGGNNRVQKFSINSLNNTYSPTSTGNYCAIATSYAGCSSSACGTVSSVGVVPTINISAGSGCQQTICAGSSLTFNSNITNGGASPTIQWKVNGANVATGASFTTTSLNNNDVVTAVLTSNASCPSPASVTSNGITMKVNPLPSITISGSGCTGSALSVTGSSIVGSSVTWYLGGSPVFTSIPVWDTVGTTVAGMLSSGSATNQLNSPSDVFIDVNDNIYVSEIYNNRIQRFPSGSTGGTNATTVAGGNGNGYAANQLQAPYGFTLDASNNIYITNSFAHRIDKWLNGASSGTTIAGVSASFGSSATQFNLPKRMALDKCGNMYIADSYNHRVQKFAPGSTVGITVAGGNGNGSTANQLSYPTDVALDDAGNLYVCDNENNRIQKFAPNSTSATNGVTVAGNGIAGAALNQLNSAWGFTVDGAGNLLIADTYNNRVMYWATGATTGVEVAGGNGYGTTGYHFNYPTNVALDKYGNFYVADEHNNRIQKFTYLGVSSYTPTTAGTYTAVVTNNNGCSGTSNTVTVAACVPNPSPSFTVNNSSQCITGNSFVFTNTTTPAPSGTTYLWNFGDGTTSTATSPSHIYTTSGNFSVQLIATYNGINYYVNNTVEVNPMPVCGFTYLASTQNGFSYTFLSTSSIGSGTMNYSWDFGDGSIGTSSNPTHTFVANGTYVVTLTVTSNKGCSCSISQVITVSGSTVPNLCDIWNNKTDYPSTLTAAAFGFTIGNKGYFGTGYDGSEKKDVWEYDASTNIWTRVADFAGTARHGTFSFVIGTKAYVGGGYDGGSNRNDFWEYDQATNIWTPKAAFPGAGRVVAIGLAINGKGYAGTGNSTGSVPFHNDWYEYNPATDTWTAKANFPDPNGRHAAAGFVIGNFGYVGTGENGAPKKDFYKYDPIADTWTAIADVGIITRSAATGFTLSNKGYIVNGVDGAGNYLKDFLEYNPITNIWTQKNSFGGTARLLSSAFVIGCSAYVGLGVVTPGTAYSKELWQYQSCGCGSTIPSPSFTINNSSQCITGNNFVFTNTSTAPSGTTYLWTFGDGSNSTTTSPTHTYTTAGYFNVQMIATYNGQQYYANSQSIYVGAVPVANFANYYNSPLTYTFNSTSTISSGSIASYSWNFGDGGTAISSNPQHAFASAGIYNVTLTVTSDAGCTATITTAVVINNTSGGGGGGGSTPSPSFTINTTQQCITGNSFVFTNTTTPAPSGTTYLWTFGDGGFSTSSSTSHTYTTQGYYNVTLKATYNGVDYYTNQQVIVKPIPVASFVTYVNTGTGISYTFQSTSTIASGSMNYAWNFGDGNTATGTSNPQHTYAAPGAYTITLTVTSDGGCVSSTTSTVTSCPTVTAGFSATGSTSQCVVGNSFTFANSSSNNAGIPTSSMSYTWYFGDGTISNLQTPPAHTYAVWGDYDVKLVVSLTSGACTMIDSITKLKVVTANPMPVASYRLILDNLPYTPTALLSDTTKRCWHYGYDFSYQSSSTLARGIMDYFWHFGTSALYFRDGDSSHYINPRIVFDTAGTYPVKLVVVSDKGCLDSVTRIVQLSDPHSRFNYTIDSTTNIYASPTVAVTDVSYDYGGYLVGWNWNFGGGVASSNSQTPSSFSYACGGNHSIVLTVTSNVGCTDDTTVNFVIRIRPKANFSISAPNYTPNVYARPTYTFTNTTTVNDACPNMSYAWKFGDGYISSATSPTHIFKGSGTYTVTLIATNNNGGKKDTTTNTVTVAIKPRALFTTSQSLVPNVYAAPTVTYNNTSSSTDTAAPVASLTYAWDFGDGTTSVLRNPPTHIYTSGGTYNVVLTVTNPISGLTDVYSLNVVIKIKPLAAFTIGSAVYSPNMYAQPSFAFTNTSSVNDGAGVLTYVWNFGDGSATSTATNPTHTYATAGTYTVTLTVTNTNGGLTDVVTHTVSVVILPQAAFSFNLNYNGNPNVVPTTEFTNGSTSNDATATLNYAWDFGDGSAISTAINPQYVYALAGTYSVKLVVTDNYGNKDSVTQTVLICPAFTNPAFSINSASSCFVGNYFGVINYYGNTGNVAMTYAWDYGDGATSTLQNPPTHSYAAVGTYDIILTTTLAYAGCATITSKDTVPATVHPMPVAGFNITGSATTMCYAPTNNYTFNNATTIASGTVASAWDFGDTTYSSATSPSHSYSHAGSPLLDANHGKIFIKLVATSDNNCRDSITDFVTLYPLPVATNLTISSYFGSADFPLTSTPIYFQHSSYANDTIQCFNQRNWFSNVVSGTFTSPSDYWQVNFDDATSGTGSSMGHGMPYKVYTTAGTHPVSANIVTAYGCLSNTVYGTVILTPNTDSLPHPVIGLHNTVTNNGAYDSYKLNFASLSTTACRPIVANYWTIEMVGGNPMYNHGTIMFNNRYLGNTPLTTDSAFVGFDVDPLDLPTIKIRLISMNDLGMVDTANATFCATNTGFTGYTAHNSSLQNNVGTYPNPAINEINVAVKLEKNTNTNFYIYNSLGKMVLFKKRYLLGAAVQEMKLNVSNFPAGVYYIILKDNSNNTLGNSKFVKLK